jgi:hypothetical protein
MATDAVVQNAILPFPGPTPDSAATPEAIAEESSLLDIDREIDGLLDLMQDELEQDGEISDRSRQRFQLFCEAHGRKVDRIGRFIRVMETREAYCKSEAQRLAERAKTAANKVAQTKSLVLYFLESRSLTKMEGPLFTLRRQKNSVDSVTIKDPALVPMHLRRVEARFPGAMWEKILAALPAELKRECEAGLESSSPNNELIKQYLAEGESLEDVKVERGHHVRVA